ncbi:MAG: hypothetical protein IPM11_00610 [Micropruina sp.]|jgi:hypothetical protein|nr:hypothetical protein [Micropruina sp.]
MSLLTDALDALGRVAEYREPCPVCGFDVMCGDGAVLCADHRMAHEYHADLEVAECAVEVDHDARVWIGSVCIGSAPSDGRASAVTDLIAAAARTEVAA